MRIMHGLAQHIFPDRHKKEQAAADVIKQIQVAKAPDVHKLPLDGLFKPLRDNLSKDHQALYSSKCQTSGKLQRIRWRSEACSTMANARGSHGRGSTRVLRHQWDPRMASTVTVSMYTPLQIAERRRSAAFWSENVQELPTSTIRKKKQYLLRTSSPFHAGKVRVGDPVRPESLNADIKR